jgi:O-antigen ligase
MRSAVELDAGAARDDGAAGSMLRALRPIVLLAPALTVAINGGANGSLMLAAALSVALLIALARSGAQAAVGPSQRLLRGYALAMAVPLVVLLAVQVLHGEVVANSLGAPMRFVLAVPVVYLLYRYGRELVPWADASFAFGAVAAGSVMLLAGREWQSGRWGSSFLDPINFGVLALLLALLSLLSIDWYRRDPLPVRALKIGGFACGMLAFVPTGARGPWLSLLVVIVLLAFTTLRRHSPAVRIALWTTLAATLIFAFATVDALRDRFDLMFADLGNFFRNGERDTSPGIRLQIWRAALLAFAERPLLGLGTHGFERAAQAYVNAGLLTPLAAEFARAEMHNSYLAFAVDFGLPGLLAVIGVFAVPCVVFAKRLGADRVQARAALMGLVVVTMYAACALSVDVFRLKMMAASYAASTALLAAIALAEARGGDAGG